MYSRREPARWRRWRNELGLRILASWFARRTIEVINVTRGVDTVAPRDNVILELGMCIGAMGRKRAFLVRPRGVELKIPTDLLGITPIDYKSDDPANLAVHLSPVCTQINQAVERER